MRVQAVPPAAGNVYQSYNIPDTANLFPPLAPRCQPGLHLVGTVLRGAMTRPVDLFCLFITAELLRKIYEHNNSCGWLTIDEKSVYGDKDGA